MFRHHLELRVKLYSPGEESFPIPLNVTLTFPIPELHKRIWMLCNKAASMTIGISMDEEICPIHGQVSLTLLHHRQSALFTTVNSGARRTSGPKTSSSRL